MFPLTVLVKAGDENFAPRVTFPGDDAGADIRAHVKDYYSRDEACSMFKALKKILFSGQVKLFIDGDQAQLTTEEAFLGAIEVNGGCVFLTPHQTKIINSGFQLDMQALPLDSDEFYSEMIPVYKIVSRSGLACKHNVVVTNAPGVIDSGYQGWVKVSLTNNSDNYHIFTHGARIAQGLYEMVFDQSQNLLEIVDDFEREESQRSTGGFGSTDFL